MRHTHVFALTLALVAACTPHAATPAATAPAARSAPCATLPPCGGTDADWDRWAITCLTPGACDVATCPGPETPPHRVCAPVARASTTSTPVLAPAR